MAKKKNVITTRLDQDLVESAQRRVEGWLDKAGAGRRVPPREAVENALAAFLPENSDKTERRIAADATARMFLNLVGLVQRHELPLKFMINLSGTRLWAVLGPKYDYHSPCHLAECDADALKQALIAQGAKEGAEAGLVVFGGSRCPVHIRRDLTAMDEVPDLTPTLPTIKLTDDEKKNVAATRLDQD